MVTVFFVNCVVVAIVVTIHYEILYRLSVRIPHMKLRHRFRIVFGVFGALIAHTLEIWVFASAYFMMTRIEGWGYFQGNFTGTFMDCVYFSFTTFTTLGFGDITPMGNLRYLTGIESLTGLVLITWTASFLYYEMQRYWDTR